MYYSFKNLQILISSYTNYIIHNLIITFNHKI